MVTDEAARFSDASPPDVPRIECTLSRVAAGRSGQK